MKIFSLVSYIIFAIGVIIGHAIEVPLIVYACKPMLMIMLFFYLFWSCFRMWLDEESTLAFALLGAWIGDVFLMFNHEKLFLVGIGGFFLMQTLYISLFQRTGDRTKKGFVQRYPYVGIPFLLILVAMLWLLIPEMGDDTILKVAVFVYGWSLILMVLATLNRGGRVPKDSFWLVFIGAFMFMVSDLFIAFNKFYTTIPHASLIIMGLYMPAQYLITEGFVRQGGTRVVP